MKEQLIEDYSSLWDGLEKVEAESESFNDTDKNKLVVLLREARNDQYPAKAQLTREHDISNSKILELDNSDSLQLDSNSLPALDTCCA